ncbi:hypothetical protein MUO93_06805 [Candidatus Bathyarchaeota archaeon]|nr:hypothetical protein [Candidatus Bathyarchaeota archaeon]
MTLHDKLDRLVAHWPSVYIRVIRGQKAYSLSLSEATDQEIAAWMKTHILAEYLPQGG